MSAELVTGLHGEPHVTADDLGGFQAGVVGTEDYVLNIGKKLEASIITNNKIRISDGEAVMQGRHWRVKSNTYEEVTIDNGQQGMNRKDAIVARYTKESETGIEKIELEVLKGTPTAGTPTVPLPTKGDIRAGVSKHEMLLYVVNLKGLSIEEVTPAFQLLTSMFAMNKDLSSKIAGLNSNLGNGYIKFENGLLIQWGSSAHGAYATVTSNVNLPVSYKDTTYRIQVTPSRNCQSCTGFWLGDAAGNNKRTTSQFQISATYSDAKYGKDWEWFTIGTWK